VLLGYLIIEWLRQGKNNGFNKQWTSWLKATVMSVVVTLNWWPWEKLASTSLGVIQFLGRLLCLTALFMMVTVVLYCNQSPFKKRTYWMVMILTCALGLSSLFEFNQSMSPVPAGDAHQIVTSSTYLSTIESGSYLPEYHPKTMQGRDALISDDKLKVSAVKTVGNQGEYLIETHKPKRIVDLPFAKYSGISYQLRLNGKIVHSQSKTHLRFKLPQHKTRLTVSTKIPLFNYLFMLSSLLAYAMMFVGLLRYH